MRYLLLTVILTLTSFASAQSSVFPGNEWEQASPESQGLDSAKLNEAISFLHQKLGQGSINTLFIVRHGKGIWRGSDAHREGRTWSVTKTFTGTVFGLLIDDRKCSLETPAKDFVPELEKSYPEINLRHFATMTSGYRAQGDEPKRDYTNGPSTTPLEPDLHPLFAPPGSHYAYWDSAMNIFGLVLTRIAHESMESLFERRIAKPVGINLESFRWGVLTTDRGIKVNNGAGNHLKSVVISAQDLARFGLLFLHKGRWQEKQLISKEWVEQATSVQVPADIPWATPQSITDSRGAYGFNWWVNGANNEGQLKLPDAPEKMFWAAGFGNNVCFVIPEWDMVIVRLGRSGKFEKEVWNSFLSSIGKAIVLR